MAPIGEIDIPETTTIHEKQNGTVEPGKQKGNIESGQENRTAVASIEEMSPPGYSQLDGFRNNSYVPEEESVTKF